MSKNSTTEPEPVDEPTVAEGMLTHVTVESEGEPAECTLIPYDSDVEEIATRWITVTEETVLDLDSMR